MKDHIKVFLSHRNADLSNFVADSLVKELQKENITVFFDENNLKKSAGVEWAKVLRDNIANSDVLVVLIEPDIEDSAWVQREIDTARGNHIRVMPLVIVSEAAKVMPVLEKFELDDLQYLQYTQQTEEQIFPAILDSIHELSRATYEEQMHAYEQWKQRHKTEPTLRQNIRAFSYTHPRVPDVQFHIATGDATDLAGYEVLVNTENNYMQMARYYESNTLSSDIRVKGAHVVNGRIRDDTVQQQIYYQIRYSDYEYIPVAVREVIVTHAGHPESDLADVFRDYRYILHAAAVEVDEFSHQIEPLPVQANPQIVRNCYAEILNVDAAAGAVIYDKDGNLNDADPEYQLLTSILFPVFGAGQGGTRLSDAVGSILDGFATHTALYRERGMAVDNIGLCIYDYDDVPLVRRQFELKDFQRIDGE